MMFRYGSHWASWQVGLMWVGMIASSALATWAVYAFATAATRRPPDSPQPHTGRGRRILDEGGWGARNNHARRELDTKAEGR